MEGVTHNFIRVPVRLTVRVLLQLYYVLCTTQYQYSVCISFFAVHERLGASRPVCSIAFALYLWVQHVIVIYVFVACTVACIVIFVAMLLCGSGASALPATKY